MFPTERHSLRAINKLQRKFPYAATLLTYAVLERCLKLHLLKKRETLTDAQVNLKCKTTYGQRLSLSDVRGLDDDAFIEKFLTVCTLFDLGQIYKVDPHHKYSSSRNDVIHSNLFLRHQLGSHHPSREKQNRAYLKKAKAHLIEASKLYFHQEITESNGSLRFKR
jgi:hypothetical protein